MQLIYKPFLATSWLEFFYSILSDSNFLSQQYVSMIYTSLEWNIIFPNAMWVVVWKILSYRPFPSLHPLFCTFSFQLTLFVAGLKLKAGQKNVTPGKKAARCHTFWQAFSDSSYWYRKSHKMWELLKAIILGLIYGWGGVNTNPLPLIGLNFESYISWLKNPIKRLPSHNLWVSYLIVSTLSISQNKLKISCHIHPCWANVIYSWYSVTCNITHVCIIFG